MPKEGDKTLILEIVNNDDGTREMRYREATYKWGTMPALYAVPDPDGAITDRTIINK